MASMILVVEDEAIIADAIQVTLQNLGYVVPTPVASGEEAIAAVEAARPNLVLMDAKIHGKMDGIETGRVLRGKYRIPVVYLTSHSDETTLARAKETQPYGYLLKPFTDRELQTVIEVALHKADMETRLAERERWFATTLQSIGDAVIATDQDEHITFMNRLAESLTGWSFDAAEGERLSGVLRLVDETGAVLKSPLTRALTQGFTVAVPPNTALIDRSGHRVVIDDSMAPIIDAQGKLLGGVAVFRDITERIRVEQRLVASERLASIGTMAAGMAHEINNPLTAVTANVDYLVETLDALRANVVAERRSVDAGERGQIVAVIDELRSVLDDAVRGGERVRRIVNDMKRFSHADAASQRSIVDLPNVLDAAVELAETHLRHDVRLQRAYSTTPYVEVNEGQLIQVFVNLLVNSMQATAAGRVEANVIRLSTFTDEAGRAVVIVTDKGVGIAKVNLARIFDPFFTTKAIGAGMGLGLAICHQVITSFGGEIAVESEVDRGTTFRVTLPAASTVMRQRSAPPPTAGAARRGRVFVIDDEPAIARTVERVLRASHDVTVETDPRAALARLMSGEPFDLILCDLMMPELNGMDLYETLEAARPEVARRVVFLSGEAFSPRTQAFMDSTANPVLSKPFSVSSLRGIAADYVKGAARDP